MKRYDVVIIGSTLESHVLASTLSKRFSQVAHIHFNADKTRKKRGDYSYSGGDQWIGRNVLNLNQDWFTPLETITIVKEDGRVMHRKTNLEGFKLYLIRHYPHEAQAIDEFMNDMQQHYENHLKQLKHYEQHELYTMDTLHAEYGTVSLQDVLNQYFKDDELIREFGYFPMSIGRNYEAILAVPFLLSWFELMYHQTALLNISEEELTQQFTSKNITTTNTKINDILFEQNIIDAIKTSTKAYYAEYVYIDADIEALFETTQLVETQTKRTKIPNRYQSKGPFKVKVFAVIDKDIKEDGFDSKVTFFGPRSTQKTNLLTLTKLPASTKDETHVAIEFLTSEKNIDLMKHELQRYIEELDSRLLYWELIREESVLTAEINKDKRWKTHVDNYYFNHFKLFDNTWIFGHSACPETTLMTSLKQTEILIERTITVSKQSLFEPSDERTVVEAMLDQVNLYQTESLAHINISVGKFDYGITYGAQDKSLYSKWNDPTLHLHGEVETLYKLFDPTSDIDLLRQDASLKVKGDEALFNTLLSRLQTGKKRALEVQAPFKLGNISLGLSMALFSLFTLLGYITHAWMMPSVFLFVHVIKMVLQTKYLKILPLLDVVITKLLVAWIILTVFNARISIAWLALFFGVSLLLSVIFKRPMLDIYQRVDERTHFTHTPLFFKMTNGLTLLWGITFLIVFLSMRTLPGLHGFAGHYVILGLFYLTYHYRRFFHVKVKVTRGN